MTSAGLALLVVAAQVTAISLACGLLYLCVRRRGPAGAARVTLAGLIVIGFVTLFTFSPWPRWEFSANTRTDRPASTAAQTSAAADQEPSATVDPAAVDAAAPTEPLAATPAPPSPVSTTSAGTSANDLPRMDEFWNTVARIMAATPAPVERARGAQWPAIVTGLLLSAAAVGLMRLLLGILAVWSCRRRCRPVTNPAVLELVDLLRAELSCRRPVAVVESPSLVTAATTGWRRPAILLPADWRNWSEDERRAVLAHELAHVARHDFLATTCAEVTRAIHFYHPLVHWLAGRLRLEQELAADAAAARLSGGQRPYLTTLAAMALRQADRPVGWPARTFLPTRRTFLRRIEMLRDGRERGASSKRQGWLSALVLVLCGASVVGLRPGFQQADLLAQQAPRPQGQPAPAGSPRPPAQPVGLQYVPADALAVAVIRPGVLLAQPSMAELAAQWNDGPVRQWLGIPLEQVEQITLLQLQLSPSAPSALTITSKEPEAFTQLADGIAPKAQPVPYAGTTYYKSPSDGAPFCYFRPNDRSILFATEPALQQLILSGKRPRAAMTQTPQWKATESDAFSAAINIELARPLLSQIDEPGYGMLAPLWEDARLVYLRLTPGGANRENGDLSLPETGPDSATGEDASLTLQLQMLSENEDSATRVYETLTAVLTLGRNQARRLQQDLLRVPPAEATPQAAIYPLLRNGLQMAMDVLEQASVSRDEAQVLLTTSLEIEASHLAMLAAGAQSAQASSQQHQALMNLKQIALALHNYHDVHGSFPASAVLGRDGKTTHSWRVAILPFVEQNALYEQYRFDEPWDSPNNRALIEKMPDVFRHPQVPAGSTVSSYYLLTGPHAMFSKEKGVSMREITDGTSNTLMVVEAKRDIPWTKPEDVPYDHSQPVPQLGGLIAGQLGVAFADGSTFSLKQGLSEAILRALISKSGGEHVEFDEKRQPVNVIGTASPDVFGAGEFGGADGGDSYGGTNEGSVAPADAFGGDAALVPQP